MTRKVIELRDVYKSYQSGLTTQTVLHGISLDVTAGEFVAIVGPSGNGKSTVLNLMAGIDRPSQGEVVVLGSPLHTMSEEALSIWRGSHVCIVFQFFQLLPALSLVQNIVFPMDLLGKLPKRERKQRALHLLDLVHLADHADKLPSQVSGGQQQRAAIARALANDPHLIVADEPTGNLDAATAGRVFQLFARLTDQGKTLVMVTHNETLALAANRRIEIRSGRVSSNAATLQAAETVRIRSPTSIE